MRAVLVLIACTVLTPPAVFFGRLVVGALQHGYGWSEMDWNGDGRTTLSEFLDATDIGKREALVCQRTCIEYFAYSDGLPVRTDCPPP